MTPLRDAMVPAAFAAVLVFLLIATLDTLVPPIIVVIDLFGTWWILTLFFVTLKDYMSQKGVS